MLQKIYQVILRKYPSELDRQYNLQVGLEKKYLEVYDIIKRSPDKQNDFSFIGALMRHYPMLHEPLECKFIQINIIKSLETNFDSNIIPLYVTEDFLNFYNYNVNDVCYLKAVVCYPLEKILLGTRTADSFRWFQDAEKLSTVVKQITEGNVLCQQGNSPLPSFSGDSNADILNFSNLITLDCQPFHQGLLTSRTSILLSDVCDFPDPSVKYKATETNVFDRSVLFDADVRNFMKDILRRQLSPVSLRTSLKVICHFAINIIPKLCSDFERELQTVHLEIDPLNTVFLSYNNQNRWNIKNGQWVKICLLTPMDIKLKTMLRASKDKDSLLPMNKKILSMDKSILSMDKSILSMDKSILSMNKSIRLAQVCMFSDERRSSQHFPSDDIAYVSPLLWFNLNKHPSCLVQPETKLLIEPFEPPPYAEEVYASLIQSPNYDGRILYDSLLKEYFNIPRFVCKDDILSINSKEKLDFLSHILDDEVDKLRWPIVHFCISRVDGALNPHGHLVKFPNTRLYQSGTKQRYVPITMETYFKLSSYHPIWNGISNGLSQYVDQLKELIMPFLNQRGKSQLSCNVLFTGPPCCGKTTVVKALCRVLNIHLYKVNCHQFSGEVSPVIEARLKSIIHKGSTYAPCIILLKNVYCIGREREAVGEDSRVIHALASSLKSITDLTTDWPILVIGTAHNNRQLSSNMVSAFLHSVQMMAPDEDERCMLLEELLSICDVGKNVSVRYLAQRTAGFVLGDLNALINQGIRNAYSRIEKKVREGKLNKKNEEDILLASVPVVQRDLLNALEKMQSEFADAIGAPKIPNVKFEDVGGLAGVKQEILNTIQLPLEHPEILFSGLRRSGVLLYGPPGSGKTLLAKAVATECSLNFLSVKGPELINMYVGQSEENVRAVFNQARSAVPCIIFFDELDSLAPHRGRSGDSGGVMDRVVSQLLAELDGLNKKSEVFVIGATNRPDLLDPALLRPGRFDRLLYVGLPEDKASKLSILKALTRKFPLAADVDLNEIADKCPPRLSGADFYSLCSNAVINRVEKNVEMLERGEKVISDISCEVTTEDFMKAMETLVPSVTPKQYKQYQAIRARIEK